MSRAQLRLSGIVVLICDDDMAEPACRLIRQYGGTCVATKSIAEAREELSADAEFFDCAVIDLMLLNGRGTDLIRELRITRPSLPCVLLSGMDSQTVMNESLDCIFIGKPVEAGALCSAILEAIGRADTEPPTMPGW